MEEHSKLSGENIAIELSRTVNIDTKAETWKGMCGYDFIFNFTEDEDFLIAAYGAATSTRMICGITSPYRRSSYDYSNYVQLTSIYFKVATHQIIITNSYQVRPSIIQALEWPN